NDVRCERNQFSRLSANLGGIGASPAGVDPHVAADVPAQYRKPLQERPDAGRIFRMVNGCWQEHANAPYALALLRPRRQRPRRCAAEQRDDLAPLDHSMTSSAVAMRVGGTVRPSILAVGPLMASSNLLDCTTGKSAGFAPLSMRPA